MSETPEIRALGAVLELVLPLEAAHGRAALETALVTAGFVLMQDRFGTAVASRIIERTSIAARRGDMMPPPHLRSAD